MKAEENTGLPHVPTDQTRAVVERAALIPTLTHDQIAALLGISDVTLRKHYRAELDAGKAKTIVQVTNSFIRNCIGDGKGNNGDVNAQKFFLERIAGLNAKTEHEHTGKGGAPIAIANVDLTELPDDQLEALARLSGALAGAAGQRNRD